MSAALTSLRTAAAASLGRLSACSTAPVPPTRLLSTPPRSPQLRRHWERRLMPCPPNELYRIVTDVDVYHEFVPWCLSSRVVERQHFAEPSATGATDRMRAEMEVGFRMLSAKYVSEIEMEQNRRVRAEAVDSPALFRRLVNEWEFKHGPEAQTTWLTFLVEFEFASSTYQAVSDLFFNEVVRQMVGAFESRWVELRQSGPGNVAKAHRW